MTRTRAPVEVDVNRESRPALPPTPASPSRTTARAGPGPGSLGSAVSVGVVDGIEQPAVTSASDSAFGSPIARRGVSRSTVGSAAARPSAARKRWRFRTDTSIRCDRRRREPRRSQLGREVGHVALRRIHHDPPVLTGTGTNGGGRAGRPRGSAFVADACGADGDLRREVDSLLARASEVDDFLSGAAAELTASASEPGPLVGDRIGPYVIESRLGAGGMGEVYRARDLNLDRDVAIKILPQVVTADVDRVARFEREARILAALNHPRIGAIYGLEHMDGVPALVLELVEGSTLAERLASGPLPLAEAVTIAIGITEALEPRTIAASSTGTSSPPTSRSPPQRRSRSSTSDSRRVSTAMAMLP